MGGRGVSRLRYRGPRARSVVSDEDRNGRRAYDLVAYAAVEETLNARELTVTDDDEIGGEHAGQRDDLGGGLTVADARPAENAA